MHKMACGRHKSRNPSRLQKTTGGHWAVLGRSVDKNLGVVMREAVPELFVVIVRSRVQRRLTPAKDEDPSGVQRDVAGKRKPKICESSHRHRKARDWQRDCTQADTRTKPCNSPHYGYHCSRPRVCKCQRNMRIRRVVSQL
jgi:hypothetical protein